MATVYLAQHTLIGRNFALKVLHSQFARDPGCVKRFMNEGRAAGTLGHPNIVASTDMGFAPDGAPFLVLELLHGKTLSAEVHQVGAFPVKRAARIAVQIASALTTAHAHHIIHRDLKPENVFLLPDDETEDHVKILDFGIARFTRGGASMATQQGALLGTPDFMAPEQITTPDKVDSRIDVYALGAILYKMLSGRAPFHNTPFPLILSSIQHDTPEPIANLRPSLPVELVEIIEKAMAKAADARYQTIEELMTVLLPFAGLSMSQVVVRRRAVTPAPGLATGQTQPGGSFAPHDTGSAPRSESALRSAAGSQPALHPSQQYLAGTGGGVGTPVIVQHHKSRWTAVAAVAAMLAAGGAVAAVLMMRDAQTPVAQPLAARSVDEAAAATPQRSADDELALYLDEVGRLVQAGRFDRAQELLQKARAVEGASAQFAVQLSHLTDEVEHGALLAKAERALTNGDRATAVDAAKQVLDRNSADEAALSILQRARIAAEAEAPASTSPPGKLYLKSSPRATVYLDDVLIGRTPIKGYEVSAGTHELELRKAGYAPEKQQITVTSRERTRVSMKLDELEPKATVARIDERVVVPPTPEPEPKVEPEPEPKVEPKPEPKVEPEPEPKVEPKPEPKVEPKPDPDAIAAPRLPTSHKVDKIKDLARALRIIEIEVVERGGVDESIAKGVTAKLARAAYDAYAPGKTITIQPRAMYYTIVKRARAGKSQSSISSELLRLHESGKL